MTTIQHATLLSPLDLGTRTLPNRIVMAPMTRARASQPGDVPNALGTLPKATNDFCLELS